MRMLTYKLQMCERGYVVASGEVQGYDSWNGRDCQPIKFSILDYRGDLDASVIKDGWDEESDFAEKYFNEHYQEILRGEDDDWYLYQFEVSPGRLILDFYNSQSGCCCYLIFVGIPRLKVKFDVPKQDGSSETHYEVRICNVPDSSNPSVTKKTAQVIECFGGVRRILNFEGRSDDPIHKEEHVSVIEYADL